MTVRTMGNSLLMSVAPAALLFFLLTGRTGQHIPRSVGSGEFVDGEPDVLLMDRTALRRTKDLCAEGRSDSSSSLRRLFDEAEEALAIQPASVVGKPQTPPSGDKHDYMSLAPYWWPDPDAPGGIPYVRRDGEINPEREKVPDRQQWIRISSAVQTLGLAYFCSGDERFAVHAALLLRTWFLDDSTRMKPNLNFGQSIRGVNSGRGAGIIEFRSLPDMLDAVKLLERSSSWTSTDRFAFRRWCEAYLRWLLTSPNGIQEGGARNNHGTWYEAQVARIALFLGSDSVARSILANAGERRIATQILPDGAQPFELERTKSWGYSLLNLEGLVALAMLGERIGIDLWQFRSPDGRSIRRAIEFLLPYATGAGEWKYPQIVPLDRGRLYPVLLIASAKYGDKRFSSAAAELRNAETAAMRANLIY